MSLADRMAERRVMALLAAITELGMATFEQPGQPTRAALAELERRGWIEQVMGRGSRGRAVWPTAQGREAARRWEAEEFARVLREMGETT